MRDQHRRILWGGAVVMAALLFGNSGFRSLLSNALEKRRLERSIAELRLERDILTKELTRIQQDPAYTEYLIRKNLGYVKKGEVEYRFVKEKNPR